MMTQAKPGYQNIIVAIPQDDDRRPLDAFAQAMGWMVYDMPIPKRKNKLTNEPNTETIAAIEELHNGGGHHAKDVDDLFTQIFN